MDFTRLFFAIRIFDISSNSHGFRTWLKSTHQLTLSNEIFIGYRYFLSSAYKFIFDAVEGDTSLRLQESKLFVRARSECEHLGKFTLDCEKAYFLYNLQRIASPLLRANRLIDLEVAIKKFTSDTQPLRKLAEKAQPLGSVSVSKTVELGTISHLYIYFHQFTNLGEPYAASTSLLREPISETQLSYAFLGYKLTLQYIWYQTLTHVPSSIRDLHKVKVWRDKRPPTKAFDFGEHNLADLLDNRKVDLRKQKDLESYFWRIKHQIIDPLSKKYKSDIVHTTNNSFRLHTRGQKSALQPLLLPSRSQNKKAVSDTLSELFFWYPTEYFNDSKNHDYIGVTNLITLISGALYLRKEHKYKDKIQVIRFKHRETAIEREAHDYSFAILLRTQLGQNFFESGWIVFFNCCSDYSGFAGSQLIQVEEMLETATKNRQLQCRTCEIRANELEKYLSQGSMLQSSELQFKTQARLYRGKLRESNGRLFELLCVYYVFKHYQGAKIRWSVGEKGQNETDIIVELKNAIHIIECKVSANNLDITKAIIHLRNNRKSVIKPRANVHLHFYFWHEPTPQIKTILEHERVGYLSLSTKARDLVGNTFDSVESLLNTK